MRSAQELFNDNVKSARQLSGIYDYLVTSLKCPLSFDDLLRSQIVYSVSAFDKFMHDLVRIGMVEIYSGRRVATSKYLSEPISLQIHSDLSTASIPPKEYIFERAIYQKFKSISYQDPDKIADGLSYIWSEKHKWKRISESIGISDDVARNKLRLIVNRRNSVVHEADIDPVSRNTKLNITKQDSDDITDFLQLCGNAIANLVI
jgi:hypothetical protein